MIVKEGVEAGGQRKTFIYVNSRLEAGWTTSILFMVVRFATQPSRRSAFIDGAKIPGQRRQAIERLINRWVSHRLEMMRLTEAEREAMTHELEKGRKQGMDGLKQAAQAGQASQTRTNCPIGDGSFGACRR